MWDLSKITEIIDKIPVWASLFSKVLNFFKKKSFTKDVKEAVSKTPGTEEETRDAEKAWKRVMDRFTGRS